MEYFVIGDEDTVLGFSLVGVSGTTCRSESEAKSAWNSVLEHHEYGVIIITAHPNKARRAHGERIDGASVLLTYPQYRIPLAITIEDEHGRKLPYPHSMTSL